MHYAFYGGSCKAKLKAPAAVVATHVDDRALSSFLTIREQAIPHRPRGRRHEVDCGPSIRQEVEHCPTESRYTLRTPKCTMHYRFPSVQLMAD